MSSLRLPVLVAVSFAAGLLVAAGVAKLRPVPAPPFPAFGEFARGIPQPGSAPFPFPKASAAEMEAALAALRTHFEAFNQKLDRLDEDFRTRFLKLLSPEQREKVRSQPLPKIRFPGFPATPGGRLGPMEGLAFYTLIQPPLDFYSEELRLSEPQRQALRELLIERRSQFLALIDSSPPPTLEMKKLMFPDGRARPPE